MHQVDEQKVFRYVTTFADTKVIDKMREFFYKNNSIENIENLPLEILDILAGKEIFLYYDKENSNYLLVIFSGKDQATTDKQDISFEINCLSQRKILANGTCINLKHIYDED